MEFGIASVAAITVICYLAAQVVKATALDNKWLPVICGGARRRAWRRVPRAGHPGLSGE